MDSSHPYWPFTLEPEKPMEVIETIEGEWGYACVAEDAMWIPVICASEEWPMRRILADLHQRTGHTRMIFSAVLSPESFKSHLRNIVREWDEWFAEIGDYSHCIEIKYEPA